MNPLAEKDRRELVRQTLWEYRKKLEETPTNNQMRALLRKSDGSKPLYLVLACEELRVFGVFERVTEKIKTMSPTIPKLLDEILARLEAEHGKYAPVCDQRRIACSSRQGAREDRHVPPGGRSGRPARKRAAGAPRQGRKASEPRRLGRYVTHTHSLSLSFSLSIYLFIDNVSLS
jgi:hypothetical protein